MRQFPKGSYFEKECPRDPVVPVTVGDIGDGFFVPADGPGIPPDRCDGVFTVDYSTANESTGSGLNIVQEIAKGHGRDIAVSNSETGGAGFEIAGVEFTADSMGKSAPIAG
ncbi:ATP-binding protein [Halodesulfurarchaeum sp.]|uniref:ATP-binding protein n=1 Tax=Halodesulfurarchaeum sp. TaxID=1980530 RepID=UPI002FC34E71